jgi:hypothetical protein
MTRNRPDCRATIMGLERKTPMKRGGRIKPVNAKRKAKNWARAYRSPAFVQWISRLPCWACGYAGPSPRQAAHTETGGMGRKADANTVIALCGVCHAKQHQSGWLAISMTEESKARATAQTQAMWEARRGSSEDDGEAEDPDAG